MSYLTACTRIEASREAVRQIPLDVGARMGWDEVEVYVRPHELERWLWIKRMNSRPFDAIRKLKNLL